MKNILENDQRPATVKYNNVESSSFQKTFTNLNPDNNSLPNIYC